MTDELDALKLSLKGLLPRRILQGLEHYDDFAALVPSDTAKEFSAHHAACKAALSHIDLLVKLLRWAVDDAKEDGNENLGEADLLARARMALEKDADDDDEEQP